MVNRSVVVGLVLDLAGYTPQTVEASKSTSALATAQRETAAAARDAATAQREASAVAKDAAAQASAAAQAQSVAYKEAATAAAEASAAQVAAAEASGEAERADAEAAAQAATARMDAAKESLAAATTEAEATAATAAAAKTAAAESTQYAATQRDVAAAAKEAADTEAAAARDTAKAASDRSAAYSKASSAIDMAAVGTAAAIGLMEKSAGDFNSQTQHLVTDAGESQSQLAMVQAGMLKVGASTGTMADQVADGMYHIESAGYHGADGLSVLTTAAQGAKVGNADLDVVSKTLTGTMNSYNLAAGQSVGLMNQIITTTAAGDMKMQDLAGSLGNVTPIAAAANIKFSQIGAAVATMTAQNMSADRATQDLAHTIGALEKPSNIQIQQMQALGLDANDVSENLGSRGLTGTLDLLTTAVAEHTQNGQVFIDTLKSSESAAADANTMLQNLPASIQELSKQYLAGTVTAAEYKKGISGLSSEQQHNAQEFEQLVKTSGGFNDLLKSGKDGAETYTAALSNLLGGATGLNTALMLTGGRMATFKANADSIQEAADKSGATVDNWSKIQGTLNQKVDVAKASLQALWIAIGTTGLPLFSDVAKWVTAIVTPIAEWVDKNQGLTEGVLGGAAALAALVLAIKAVQKIGDGFQATYDGVRKAIDFFSKSADAAAVESQALSAANSAAAESADAVAAASTTATVKVDAMATSTSAAATETEAAAVSTGGWARNLGMSLPIIGAVVLGAQALAGWVNKLAQGNAAAATSGDQWTTAMLDSKVAAGQFGITADQAQKMLQGFGGQATDSIEPVAAVGAALAKAGQEMGKGADVVKNYDSALAQLASSGQGERAAAIMAEITSATDKQGNALINTQADFPQYWAAVNKNTANQALSAASTTDSTTALGANTTALGANAAATLGATDATAAGAAGTDTSTDALTDQAKAVSASTMAQFQAAGAARALADAQAAQADKAAAADAAHKSGTLSLKSIATAEGNAAASADTLDSSVTDEVDAMKQAQTQAGDLSDALDALNGVHIAASKAAIDVQQKTADLTAALQTNGKTLDITTDAGRKNMTAIDDLATAINEHAKAVTDETGSVEAGNQVLDANRAQFDAVLKAAGLSTSQIQAFNTSLLQTPKVATVTLAVNADTSAAAASLQKLENQYAGTGLVFGGHHIVPGYSSGGLVTGRGNGTSDSNLIAASNGEYIFTAASVARIGLDNLERWQYGGSTTVVKPQIPLQPLAASPTASRTGSSPALHIEHYYENGTSPQAVAAELGWLRKTRSGSSW